ncbi:MAG: DUF368 domain-containing protein [Planctomycetales bacterium]|nr:DUF368 domain-containing protein [Planctomycetales bacterium]
MPLGPDRFLIDAAFSLEMHRSIDSDCNNAAEVKFACALGGSHHETGSVGNTPGLRLAMKPSWHTIVTGFCMGAADVVPGISGGTVALLFGIYLRLLKAIRSFDGQWLRLVLGRQWGSAWRHIDATFLCLLAAGLVVGFGCSALTVKRLLAASATRSPTLACFAGLILASALLLAHSINVEGTAARIRLWVSGLIGLSIGAAVSLLRNSEAAEHPSLVFVFACGVIGICAMILPGISGAMILLLIGVYEYLLSMPDRLLHGEATLAIQVVVVFGCGCALGLLSFSRLLSWLLNRYQAITTACLVGLMVGSTVKLWPFRDPESSGIASLRLPGSVMEGVIAGLLFLIGLSVVRLSQRFRPAASRANDARFNKQGTTEDEASIG